MLIEQTTEYYIALRQWKGKQYTSRKVYLSKNNHFSQASVSGNTIERRLIESFAPGEVNLETAYKIGKKLATEILGGQYAVVMATHIDVSDKIGRTQ